MQVARFVVCAIALAVCEVATTASPVDVVVFSAGEAEYHTLRIPVLVQAESGALLAFAAGSAGPLVALLAYNTAVFGSPFELGYAHHVVPRFRALHGRGNPLGLGAPRWELARALLISEYKGLFIYAPIVALAPVGWLAGGRRGTGALRVASLLACCAVFVVNLSYPEWTGGWSTGPRLLVPLLPFGRLTDNFT